jgi:hypothetical protein
MQCAAIDPHLEADVRKRFLVLASVATMALTGAAAPAFADTGTAAAAAPAPATVTVMCAIRPALVNPGTGQVVDSFTLQRVAPQAAAFLTATVRTFTNPLTGVPTTVECHIVV